MLGREAQVKIFQQVIKGEKDAQRRKIKHGGGPSDKKRKEDRRA